LILKNCPAHNLFKRGIFTVLEIDHSLINRNKDMILAS
jgi:hypothetical protein